MTDTLPEEINTFLEDKKCQEALYKAYGRILSLICTAMGIDKNYIEISPYGMSSVFAEVQSDLCALKMRRAFGHGISKGKLAGSIAFRLCKTPVFTMGLPLASVKAAQKLHVNAAVAFAFAIVETDFSVWPAWLIRELKYFLGKRHSNQESLGICFDTIACSNPKRRKKAGPKKGKSKP